MYMKFGNHNFVITKIVFFVDDKECKPNYEVLTNPYTIKKTFEVEDVGIVVATLHMYNFLAHNGEIEYEGDPTAIELVKALSYKDVMHLSSYYVVDDEIS